MRKEVRTMKILDKELIGVFKETSKTLTDHARRAFQAKITKTCLDGNVRKAESIFGWGRETVSLGLKELERASPLRRLKRWRPFLIMFIKSTKRRMRIRKP
jgi:hypothetical protein